MYIYEATYRAHGLSLRQEVRSPDTSESNIRNWVTAMWQVTDPENIELKLLREE